jgi:DNA-binding response OmpR family regulator
LNQEPSILCVDDDPDFLDILCRSVASRGGVVVGAPSSEAALAICAQQRFALVITDLDLPRANGRELILKLRSIDSTIPILVVTGSGSDADREAALAAGAAACLIKPVPVRELAEMVSRLLRDAER